MMRLYLLSLLMLTACTPKEHDGLTHEQFWNSAVHQGHNMSGGQHHDAGHDFECTANGYRLDHCDENHGGDQ